MHVWVFAVEAAAAGCLCLLELQNLQDLGLQQPQAEIVVGDEFVCRPEHLGRWFSQSILLADEAVLQQRGELGGDYLIGYPERAADADTDQTVERIRTPPQ